MIDIIINVLLFAFIVFGFWFLRKVMSTDCDPWPGVGIVPRL